MAKIRNIRTRRIPTIPVVASKKPWPVVAQEGEWPIVAEAGKRKKTKKKKRSARQIQQAIAKQLGIKPPPARKAKLRKRVTRKAVARGVARGRGAKRGPTGMPEFIQRVPVTSSNVASIGYDEPSMLLEIEFHSGAVYRYFSFPISEWKAFRRAKSKGRFVWRRIRGFGADDLYVYSRVD